MSDPRFFVGVNLPWLHYGCDFGTNAWRPQGGVAAGQDTARIETVLGTLAASGASLVRWILFCDGRAGLEFRSGGQESPVDDRVIADRDAALDMVAASGLRKLPVCLGFSTCHAARSVGGVQTGGR